jgi:CHAT domain-containing protein/tetratricopeptide (TPR) repeat protein
MRKHRPRPLTPWFWPGVVALAAAVMVLVHARLTAQAPDAPATSPPAGEALPESREARRLAAATTVEGRVTDGRPDVYVVRLEPGQFFQVTVAQRGVDVALSLHEPDGARRLEADYSVGPRGREAVSLVAETPGDFRLEVRENDPTTSEGGYSLTAEAPRAATDRDRDRVAAERLLAEGRRLLEDQTAESRRQAVERFARALPLWRGLGDRFFEALCLYDEGRARQRLGENPEAQARLTEALALWRALGEPAFEAATLNMMGVVHFFRTEHPQALECFTESLRLRREVGDRRGEAETLANVGIGYGSLGRLRDALAVQEQALDLLRRVGDRSGEANLLQNMAESYRRAGEMQRAIDLLHEALTLSRAIGDRKNQAAALKSLATVSSTLGEPQEALQYYREALEIWRALGHRNGESGSLEGLALLHLSLGETWQAVHYYEQIRALHRAMNDGSSSLTLVRMATAYRRAGDENRASDLLQEGLQPQPQEDPWFRAQLFRSLGQLYTELGQAQKAVDYHERALASNREVHDRVGEASALYELARLDLGRNALLQARERLEASLALLEATRNELGSQELRASFAAPAGAVHELYVDVLMRLHEREPAAGFDALAFGASERSRVQSLLELLAESQVNLREGADPALLRGERAVREQLAYELEQQMRLLSRSHTSEEAAAAAAAVQARRREHRRLQGQIRVASPRYAALRQPEVLAAREVQRRLLDPGTLLLEYALGDQRSFLFAVTPASSRTYVLPGRAEVEAVAARARDRLATPGEAPVAQDDAAVPTAAADSELAAALAAASRLLLGPVAGELGARRLVIAADGLLQYLPFAALPAPDRPDVPLVRDHEVVSVSSASLLSVLRSEAARRRPASKTLAVFADPVFDPHDERVAPGLEARTAVASHAPRASAGREPRPRRLTRAAADTGLEGGAIPRLPFTRREARGILSLVSTARSRAALDFEASRKTATAADLADYRYVHFATHGFLNHAHPELSGLVLSLVDATGAPQEGFLSAGDVFNLKLSADLVVLSGCRTAVGRQVKGEGVLGLTRAFMYAGTPRVLASLWKVDDAATAELMTRLYQGILTDGLRPAAALRQAQVALAQQKRWAHPYYWAGFQLQGDWN